MGEGVASWFSVFCISVMGDLWAYLFGLKGGAVRASNVGFFIRVLVILCNASYVSCLALTYAVEKVLLILVVYEYYEACNFLVSREH